MSTSIDKLCPAINSATSRRATRIDDEKIREGQAHRREVRGTQLASLRSVVVSGAPPLASRICRRVSGKSRPASEDVAGAAAAGRGARAGGGAGAGAVAVPSRSAFSCAAFCARSRLSASIFSLIAARAFLSFSFSVERGCYYNNIAWR